MPHAPDLYYCTHMFVNPITVFIESVVFSSLSELVRIWDSLPSIVLRKSAFYGQLCQLVAIRHS